MENTDNKEYEIGYLLSPFLPESNLDAEVAVLRKIIEENHGFIMAEGYPKMQKLAYIIRKPANVPGQGRFSDAFWGWMKFMLSSEMINSIKTALEKNSNLIRFLIIKTSKETPVLNGIKHGAKKKPVVAPVKETGAKIEEASLKEIDKKLDELLGV